MSADSAGSRVFPLNDFQRLMRMWEEFRPFSGIDAIEANSAVDADRLRVAVEAELAILGVGYPVASADGRTVTYRSERPTVTVETAQSSAGTAPLVALAEHCAKELNRPFQREGDLLVRVWIVPADGRSFVGMTWQHWPIDGVSAGDLFRGILARYAGAPLTHDVTATELTAPDLAAVYAPWQTWRRKLRDLSETLRETWAFSRAFPTPRPRPEQTSMRVRLIDLPHPPRPPGATVNDVVTAALLWALADALPERLRKIWRRRLNVITFVDLRSYTGEALRRVWGSFLGFAIMHMPEPRPGRLEELIDSLRLQSLRGKEEQSFFASLGGFGALRTATPWLPRGWRWSLPYRMTPFTAGLTNTRFRGEWTSEPLGSQFGRSWRVAPVGCMAPLTADMCTKGNDLSLALSYEENSLLGDRIETIATTMRGLLEKPG